MPTNGASVCTIVYNLLRWQDCTWNCYGPRLCWYYLPCDGRIFTSVGTSVYDGRKTKDIIYFKCFRGGDSNPSLSTCPGPKCPPKPCVRPRLQGTRLLFTEFPGDPTRPVKDTVPENDYTCHRVDTGYGPTGMASPRLRRAYRCVWCTLCTLKTPIISPRL